MVDTEEEEWGGGSWWGRRRPAMALNEELILGEQ